MSFSSSCNSSKCTSCGSEKIDGGCANCETVVSDEDYIEEEEEEDSDSEEYEEKRAEFYNSD